MISFLSKVLEMLNSDGRHFHQP